MIYNFVGRNGVSKIYDIISMASDNGRHCVACKFFDRERPEKCKKSMWTGVGDRHAREYPTSYANHDCHHYRTKFKRKV